MLADIKTTSNQKSTGHGKMLSLLLGTTILTMAPGSAFALQSQNAGQAAQQPPSAPVAAPQGDVIRSITVNGTQRVEPDTVRSYIKMRVGDVYSQAAADTALRDLYETELFADVSIRNNQGAVVINIQENPIINRIILEGNKRLKDDKIYPEIRLAPRQIFTRTKIRVDVARIIELYKRQGRFAAEVNPKMVNLDQNRVDIVFEITENPALQSAAD